MSNKNITNEPPARCPHGFEPLQTLAERLPWPIAGIEMPDWEQLRRALVTYAHICRREIPSLTRNEWCLIADALRSTPLDPESGVNLVNGATASIQDAIHIEGLDAKWNVDARALVARLQTYSYATFVALLEVVSRVKTDCDDRDHFHQVIDEAVALGELYARRPELRRAGEYPQTIFADHGE